MRGEWQSKCHKANVYIKGYFYVFPCKNKEEVPNPKAYPTYCFKCHKPTEVEEKAKEEGK